MLRITGNLRTIRDLQTDAPSEEKMVLIILHFSSAIDF